MKKVSVESDVKSISQHENKNYVRQLPNTKLLGIFPVRLGIYNDQRRRRENRLAKGKKLKDVRQLGEPPVIFDPGLTEISVNSLKQFYFNKGYFEAEVTYHVDTVSKKKRQRAIISYYIKGNEPHKLNNFSFKLSEKGADDLIKLYEKNTLLKKGMNFDSEILDQERSRVSSILKNNGYYYFDKNYLFFEADSVSNGNRLIDVELKDLPFERRITRDSSATGQELYKVNNVYYYTNFEPHAANDDENVTIDTIRFADTYFIYKNKKNIRPQVLMLHSFVLPDNLYRQSDISKTYASIGRLGYFRYLNVQMRDLGQKDSIDGLHLIDCHISMLPAKAQSFSIDLEGTNSSGDFGFATNLNYSHKNIFKGAELFKVRFRAAYENLSNVSPGLVDFNSLELLGEISLTFPRFLFPFLKMDVKRGIDATSEVKISYTYQQRPYYKRNIASIGLKYSFRQPVTRHFYDFIDVNIVSLPWIDEQFKDKYLGSGSLIRYSYEDHFIMRTAYSLLYTKPVGKRSLGENVTIRTGIETAGNLLYGIYKAANIKEKDGSYRIFNITFSQYVKGDFDIAYRLPFDTRSSMVFHVGLGVGYPYGNSTILPFEKRYYAGGANSVRGWSVRTLGPGTYKGDYEKNNGNRGAIDYMNQVGDIKLDLNLEYRIKMFWKIEGALFVDAGNVWSMHAYEEQPGGEFLFNKFYKQIALGYGVGIRLDFTYFLIRLDLGIKAYDPGRVGEEWRFKNVTFKKDMALHFAIGYPF